jgi:hypothetical protein
MKAFHAIGKSAGSTMAVLVAAGMFIIIPVSAQLQRKPIILFILVDNLGSHDGCLPSDQGFDESYDIPRTAYAAMWPGTEGYSPDLVPPLWLMKGRKGSMGSMGNKSSELTVYNNASVSGMALNNGEAP